MLAFSAPLSMASGQEKKNEQKIKIIVSDDSGTKTVIDTIFTGDKLPGTITLKDGKVVHITRAGTDLSHLDNDSKGTKVHVTVSSDLEDGKETEGIVIRQDSGKSFSIVVADNDEESDSDVTKYVIAKDGVVVTIESDDEAKAKELMKEIESRLDAKTDTKKVEKK